MGTPPQVTVSSGRADSGSFVSSDSLMNMVTQADRKMSTAPSTSFFKRVAGCFVFIIPYFAGHGPCFFHYTVPALKNPVFCFCIPFFPFDALRPPFCRICWKKG